MTKSTIILMEDDEDLRELYRILLEAADYSVILKNDSSNIVKFIDTHRPALVITDMVMPDSEGMEGIFQILQDKKNTPVIAISGYPDYLRLAEPFVSACLLKPLIGSTLVDTVNRVLCKT